MSTTTGQQVVLSTRRPDTDNWFIEPVVADWFNGYIDDGGLEKEMAVPGTRIRASWAGDCARALAYRLIGMPESDPVTVADCWRFNVGTVLHEHVQRAIEKRYPGSRSEVKLHLVDLDGSAHMDIHVIRPGEGRDINTAVEVKTINGTGFRRQVDARNPEGIRYKYVFQGALNAKALDPQPDELVIAVFSLETMSPAEAKKQGIENEYQRFAAQWTFTRDEYLAIADRETRRLNRIIELVDSGPDGWLDVPRMFPDPSKPKHKVINPFRGDVEIENWDGTIAGVGHAWQCEYCPFQSQCGDDREKEIGRELPRKKG